MKKIIAVLGLILALFLGLTGRALAHAELASSTPAAGARLASAPKEITLVFDEEIDEAQSSFTVTSAAGATISTGALDLNDLDRKTLKGAVSGSPSNGVYTVTWKVVTPDDNGVSEGSFTFGVNADPGPQPEAEHEDATAAATSAPAATNATAAARPTAAATAAAGTAATARPAATTAAGATNPDTLPQTGGESQGLTLVLLLAAIVLIGGLALRGAWARRS